MSGLHLNPDGLPNAESVHMASLQARRVRDKTRNGERLATLSRSMQALEEVALTAMVSLFRSSGALVEGEEPRSHKHIMAALGAAPRHDGLVRRWLSVLVREELVVETPDGYSWTKRRVAREANRADLIQIYAGLGFPKSMASVHALAIEQLGALIRDQLSIQELLFREGGAFGALEAYQDNIFNIYLNEAAAQVLASRTTDGGRPLKVLELGGGTGGSTQAALSYLAGRALDYAFTDVSNAFVRAGQGRFRGVTGLHCRTLDINTDFDSQGFSCNTVDVVLAANVLHNATHTRLALERIRRVLSPGGCLIFTEATHETAAISTGIGFLLSPVAGEPWPFRNDPCRREGRVFLDAASWRKELINTGFTPHITLPPDASPLRVAGQELFVAVAR